MYTTKHDLRGRLKDIGGHQISVYAPELRLDGDGLLGEGDLDGLREVRRRRVEAGLVRVPVDHVRQAVGACGEQRWETIL